MTVLVLALAVAAGSCVGPRTPGDLRSELFADTVYQRDTRPNVAIAAATDTDEPWAAPPDEVEVGLRITTLSSVAATTSTYTVEQTLVTSWKDQRLRFNTSDAGGCFRPGSTVDFELAAASEIWTPDLYFNTMVLIGPKDDSSKGGMLQLSADGTVKLTRATRKTFSCSFDFKRAPFDEHHCEITVSAIRASSTDDILFTPAWWTAPNTGTGTPSWTIVEMDGYNATNPFGSSFVSFVLTIRRDSDYYILTVLIPATLFVVVSWTSFFISRSAVPARVGMTVSSLLIISNFHNTVLQQLPQFSGFVYMVWYVRVSLAFCMYAVLEFALCNLLTRTEARFERAIAEIERDHEAPKPVQPITSADAAEVGVSVSATAKGEPAMDKAVVISKVAKISKVTKLLVNRHGKLCLRDQHPDIFSRWLFLPAYLFIVIVMYPW